MNSTAPRVDEDAHGAVMSSAGVTAGWDWGLLGPATTNPRASASLVDG
jgi:hypothetical protein